MIHQCQVHEDARGMRLDIWLEQRLEGCTRSLVNRCIKAGRCQVGRPQAAASAVMADSDAPAMVAVTKLKAGYALRGDEVVSIEVPEAEPLSIEPEAMDLDIVYEDDGLLIINKAPRVVVHPAIGHRHGTLINGVLHYLGLADPCSHDRLRPALIHRLDADTSGVIAVAKTEAALHHYQAAFAARTVRKRYLALVHGAPKADFFEHDGALGRHPKDFRKRAVWNQTPHAHDVNNKIAKNSAKNVKEAFTSFVVRQRHHGYSVIEARPKTGRTHQIRVHLADKHHPILADATYGRGKQWPLPQQGHNISPHRISRQALHAWQLALPFPESDEMKIFNAPIPADLLPLCPDLEIILPD